jgi:hypothetical protein
MEDRVQQFGRPTGASVGRCRWVPSVVRGEQPGRLLAESGEMPNLQS